MPHHTPPTNDDALGRLISPRPNPNEINANPSTVQAAASGQSLPQDFSPDQALPGGQGPGIPGEQVPGLGDAEQGNIITPEQRAELEQMLSLVQSQNSKLVTNKLSTRNELGSLTDDLMGQLFQILSDAGVDPSNPQSVRAFMESLAERDPDLLEIFESAFVGLLEDTPERSLQQAVEGEDARPQSDIENSDFDSPVTDRFRNLSRFAGAQGPAAANDGQLGPENLPSL